MLERRWRAGGMQGCACTRWPVWGGLPVQLVAALAVLLSLARMHSCWARAHSNAPTPRQSLATARARTFNRTSARTCTYTLAHRHLHKHAHDHTPPSTESRAHAITLVSVCTRTNTCVCLRVCTHCLRVRACGRTRTRSSLLLLLLLASSPPFLLSSSPPAPLLWRVSKWFRRQRYLQLPLARC